MTDSGPTFHLLTFSSTLIINPTYRALPVSLHHKLTFILLFFSVLLTPFFPFTPLSPFPPPPPLFSSSCSKVVHVKIIDDEEYEKNKNFFLELAEPRMVDMSLQKGAVLNLSLSLSPVTFSVSRSHTLSLLSALRLPPGVYSAHFLFTLLYLLLSSPPASPLLFYTAVHARTLYLIAMPSHGTSRTVKTQTLHRHPSDSLPRRRRHLHKNRTGSRGVAVIYSLQGARSRYYVKARFT